MHILLSWVGRDQCTYCRHELGEIIAHIVVMRGLITCRKQTTAGLATSGLYSLLITGPHKENHAMRKKMTVSIHAILLCVFTCCSYYCIPSIALYELHYACLCVCLMATLTRAEALNHSWIVSDDHSTKRTNTPLFLSVLQLVCRWWTLLIPITQSHVSLRTLQNFH